MQKHGWRLFPVIQIGAGQTCQTRTGAMGNYGGVNLECKKQILLWACPTPTKGNCWCCLRTTGGVPTPHGSAVESHCVSLFFLLHIHIELVLTVMYWLYILLQTPTLFTGGHNVLLNSSHQWNFYRWMSKKKICVTMSCSCEFQNDLPWSCYGWLQGIWYRRNKR